MVSNPTNNDLQPSQGSKFVILYRRLDKAATEDAKGMALETDSELSKTRSTERLNTKAGSYVTPSVVEVSGSASSFFAQGDTAIRELEDSIYSPIPTEFWFIDQNIQNEDGKFEAEYFQGFVTDFTKTGATEGALSASLSYELSAPLEPARGWATLTREQAAVVNYVFRDTIAGSAPEVTE